MCSENWVNEVRVLNIKLFAKGTLRAWVDIQLGPLTIRGLRVMEGENGFWTSWPQDCYQTRDGFRRFVDLVQPTKEISDAVNQAIKAKWAKIGPLYSTDKSFN